MKIITIKTFDDPIKANLFLSKLENEGIYCFLEDENMVTIDPFASNAIGGIKLKIEESDYIQANNLLKSMLKEETNKCSNCGAFTFIMERKKTKGILSGLVVLFSLFYPFDSAFVKRCTSCGQEVKNKQEIK